MTAGQLVTQLLQVVISNKPIESVVRTAPGFAVDSETARRQYESSARFPSIPPIEPPNGVVIPRSPYEYLSHMPSSSATVDSDFSLLTFDGMEWRLPTPEALHCINRLVCAYHARLFLAIDRAVSQWLSKVNMTMVSSLQRSQWIYPHGDSFIYSFPTPRNIDTCDEASPHLVLFLVHGTVTPPGCYHVWLDDGGPCIVDQVILGEVEQRPLARQFFVSTLIPLDVGKDKQSIRVNFCSNIQKGVCIAPLVLLIKRSTQRLQSTSNCDETRKTTSDMPRLRQRPR